MITGNARRETIREINIEGTRQHIPGGGDGRAPSGSCTRRRWRPTASTLTTPSGMTEDWPTRPAKRLFYAQEKAELEQLLNEEAAAHPGLGLYVLRPPVVLGPHAVGAKACSRGR